MDNVMVFDHLLISFTRFLFCTNKATGTNEFRASEEIAMLMGYEALRDLPLEMEVETPIETCMTP